MDQKLIKRLEKFYSEHPTMKGAPVTTEQINEAETALNINLPEDYVDFVCRFGEAYAGIDIYAFEDPRNSVKLTKEMRIAYGNGDIRENEALKSILIGDDGAGNPFLINEKGEVVIFYHDCDEREVLAQSLGEFIEENFEEW
ncbi:SMI1/KNR4 family protein [Bacteroides sp. 224]|nr:SMI1/KNR4 family protein [Bacteroides sp. 224]